jgi:aminoglycoside 6'-N-acetyltransferase
VVVEFRRLTDDDLPMLHRWLNEPGVVRWWEGEDVSWEAVVRDYGSANDEPTEHWIAVVDGRDVGWIQCYAWADYADEEETQAQWAAGVDRAGAGIDYLVADPAARGRGIGAAMIRAFVDDVVFANHPSWTQASAGPFLANVASWRALARAGFRHLADYDAGDDDGPCRVMVRDRTVAGDA